jgi:predicted flap endonuclease-1-like 5' DNA nuclease
VDDLTLIEGVGPRIVGLLQQQGITTFAQLAAVDIPRLEQILQENHLQFIKPDSWPEQARLASQGKMTELKALQDRLIAGGS